MQHHTKLLHLFNKKHLSSTLAPLEPLLRETKKTGPHSVLVEVVPHRPGYLGMFCSKAKNGFPVRFRLGSWFLVNVYLRMVVDCFPWRYSCGSCFCLNGWVTTTRNKFWLKRYGRLINQQKPIHNESVKVKCFCSENPFGWMRFDLFYWEFGTKSLDELTNNFSTYRQARQPLSQLHPGEKNMKKTIGCKNRGEPLGVFWSMEATSSFHLSKVSENHPDSHRSSWSEAQEIIAWLHSGKETNNIQKESNTSGFCFCFPWNEARGE